MAAAALEAVVLTHAHLDHCGYLPALVDQGFTGPVLATQATIALATLALRDSAKLQEEDARYAAAAGFSKHARPRPLYDGDDVERVIPMFRPVEFHERVEAAPGIELVLQPAGPPACDVIVVESTYGDRDHSPEGGGELAEVITRTARRVARSSSPPSRSTAPRLSSWRCGS